MVLVLPYFMSLVLLQHVLSVKLKLITMAENPNLHKGCISSTIILSVHFEMPSRNHIFGITLCFQAI